MANAPIFIAPPEPPKRKIDPLDQEVFDSCGTCKDCLYMLENGLVE